MPRTDEHSGHDQLHLLITKCGGLTYLACSWCGEVLPVGTTDTGFESAMLAVRNHILCCWELTVAAGEPHGAVGNVPSAGAPE